MFEILLTLRDEAGDADAILSRMGSLGTKTPPIASFYRSLKRASDDSLLDVLDPMGEGAPGRPRQRYAITRAGRHALRAEAVRLRRLSELALSPKRPESGQ